MEDPEDNGDPVVTAQRETMEELGVPTSAIRILGTYHQSLSKTKIPVTAVIGYLGDFDGPDLKQHLSVNEDEIGDVFTLTLDELTDPTKHEYLTYSVPGRYKSFVAGPYPVWGLTAFIMDETLNELILNTNSGATAKL
jgi:8-oxo-dGTP pyrophosphatase MutT (NUDIX family)